jgi:hypothetical protein
MTSVMTPTVLWAQRPDRLYLTIELWEAENVKMAFPDSTHFSFEAQSGQQAYKLSLEFYGAVKTTFATAAEDEAGDVKSVITNRHITLEVMKESSGAYWPRLLKASGKNHFIKTDFDKWVDEDELHATPENDFGGGMGAGMGGMDFASMMQGLGGAGGMGGDMPNFGDDFEPEEEDEGEEEPLDEQIRDKLKKEAAQEEPSVCVTETSS